MRHAWAVVSCGVHEHGAYPAARGMLGSVRQAVCRVCRNVEGRAAAVECMRLSKNSDHQGMVVLRRLVVATSVTSRVASTNFHCL